MTDSIIFVEKNETGIIYLNNPKSLNALSLQMVELMHLKLMKWQKKINIKRILLKGEGKAFCAGGDAFCCEYCNECSRSGFRVPGTQCSCLLSGRKSGE